MLGAKPVYRYSQKCAYNFFEKLNYFSHLAQTLDSFAIPPIHLHHEICDKLWGTNEWKSAVCLFVCYYCINKKYGHVHANKLFAIHSALEWCLFIEITELQLLTASKCGIWLIHSILMANTFSIWNIPFSVYFGIDSLWTEMDETFCHSMWQL